MKGRGVGTALVTWPFVGRHAELERIGDALADPGLSAVVITGRSGVGKSRLAHEAMRLAESRDHPTVHIIGAAATATVPLAAVAALLPASTGLAEPVAVFAAGLDHIRSRYAGTRLVVVVDDADLLDPVSSALLGYLLTAGAVFVVATVVADRDPPESLDALWRAGHAIRIELEPLDRGGCDRLLHMALRGPITAPAALSLWEASRGNVLYLRELVLAAREDGVLRDTDGVWSLGGRLGPGAGAAAVVQRRLRELPPADRHVLDRLAVCGPLGVDDVAAQHPEADLASLEERELIVVRVDHRRHEISVAHPLHATVITRALPVLAARKILTGQIGRIEGYGARRAGDPLRLASWRLDATGTADAALLAQAAILARGTGDPVGAKRLANAALRQGPHVQASLVLGEVLADEGDTAGAEDAFSAGVRAADPAENPEAFAALTFARCLHLAYRLGRMAEAADALATALIEVGREHAPQLVGMQALLELYAGRPQAALDLLGDLDPPHGTYGRSLALHARASSQLELGLLDDAESVCRAAYEEFRDARTAPGHPPPTIHLAVLAPVLDLRGRFAEAVEVCAQGEAAAAATGDRVMTVRFAGDRGWNELNRGRPVSAAACFRAAIVESGGGSAPLGPSAGLVIATAIAGAVDPDALAHLKAAAADATISAAGIQIQRALAWADASAGDLSGAVARLVRTADECQAQGLYMRERRLRHDIVRIGRPDLGVHRLRALASGEFGAAVAEHADAAIRRSAPDLLDLAARFGDYGALLVAAEAATHAAECATAAGDTRLATRAKVYAQQCAAQCQGARTPGLLRPAVVNPLSPREREIAVLAAAGAQSRDIADRLFLSVRTVNNHLQNAYTKLGVSNRGELGEALRLSGAEGSVG